MRLLISAICLLILTSVAQAQSPTPTPECRLYLANQVNAKANSGFSLSLESVADTKTPPKCQLKNVILRLSVGDGTAFHHIDWTSPSWAPGTYIAKAIIENGRQQLYIGYPIGAGATYSLVGEAHDSFTPAKNTILYSSYVADSGEATEDYIVTQLSQEIMNGSSCIPNGTNCVSIAPNPLSLPLILLAGGPAPWATPSTSFTVDATQTTTIWATFSFDRTVSDPHVYDPYIDPYGQAVAADWPSKIHNDNDLLATVAQEKTWLGANPQLYSFAESLPFSCAPPSNSEFDQFGGSTVAGWNDTRTNYYYADQHNGRWFLISPCGNPLFYIGMTAIPDYKTPITGREGMFEQMAISPTPSPTPSSIPPDAYSYWPSQSPSPTVTYVSFSTANMIRKEPARMDYGSSWQDQEVALMHQRFSSWGFMGGGKFGSFPTDFPITPVLAHNGFGTFPNAPGGMHLDIFNSETVKALRIFLQGDMVQQTCSDPKIKPQTCDAEPARDRRILGWSVGNEKDGIITAAEIQGILAEAAASPAKTALIDYAFITVYGSDLNALATAWNINPHPRSLHDVYTNPQLTPLGIEPMRQYYEQEYYSTLYQAVKALDKHHLYLGIWILAADSVDWPLVAANCDVVGFDDFSPGPLSKRLQKLFAESNKPVLLGAWGVPSDYGGTRGFGWSNYENLMNLSDEDSGKAYSRLMKSAAANQYVVGAMLFDYRDEPLTGRGNNNDADNISSALVVDENYAFGLVDITDTPKYDLVNKVRSANIAALKKLGLLK